MTSATSSPIVSPSPQVASAFQFSYEQNLSRTERRQFGKFYTPPEITAFLLDCTGYRATTPIENALLLDPACGTGNFLLAAAHILVTRCRQLGWTAQAILRAVQRNLHGFDLDEAACHLARLSLRQEVLAPLAAEAGCDLDSLSLNIHPKDSLLHYHSSMFNVPNVPIDASALRLDASECAYGRFRATLGRLDLFDYIVGNPPYLASKNTDLSRYQALGLISGQSDVYLLFVTLAYRLLRIGGQVGLLLPDSFLIRRNASLPRQLLIDKMTLLQLVHLRNIFAAGVSNVVITARKEVPAPTHSVQVAHHTCRRQEPRFILPTLTFQPCPQVLFQQQENRELRYHLRGNLAAVLAKIGNREHPRYAPLEALLSLCRGEEVGRESAALHRDSQAGLPVLRGGQDLDRYRCFFHGWYLPVTAVKKPLTRYQQPKLLVVKSTGQLKAALDTENRVVLQTLYLLHAKEGDHHQDLRYLLALLNSPLLRAYLLVMTTSYKLVQPQIEQADLRQLPLRALPPRDQAPFIALVDRLLLLHVSETDTRRQLEQQLNQLTAELYELTPKEKLRVETDLL